MPAQAKIGSPFTRNQVRIFDPGVPSASANSVSGMRQRLAGLPAINFHMKLERSAILFTAFGLIGSPVLLLRSEEHTSELQSLMRISYAVFCLKKKKKIHYT